MTKFLDEFSDETQIIISNVIGLTSVLIFIYTSCQSNYYSNLYLELNRNVFSVMTRIGMLKFFVVFMIGVFSIFLSLYSIYLNIRNTINSIGIFNKVCGAIGVIATVIGLGFGLYNSRSIFKLFIIITMTSILLIVTLSILFNSEET